MKKDNPVPTARKPRRGAALMLVLPPLLAGTAWKDALYRAMTLLVVASPCALVIAPPATVLSAIANAARNGILFKGGRFLESLGRVRAPSALISWSAMATLMSTMPW